MRPKCKYRREKRMYFFAFKGDLDRSPKSSAQKKDPSLTPGTSVLMVKSHFFKCLRELGEVRSLASPLRAKKLRSIFKKPGAFSVHVHYTGRGMSPAWTTIPKRSLVHSLGTFLLPFTYYYLTDFPINSVLFLVTTEFQMTRMKKYLGKAAPLLGVFTPRLNEKSFYPPTGRQRLTSRKTMSPQKKDIHIVYAGRFLATKGICQLIRTLGLWPIKNVKITLVGDFNPDFPIQIASASHFTFANYFDREFIRPNLAKQVTVLKTKDADGLRELYWSADLFVYASVHEDENFGLAPREAVLCGLPVVVADFCGLHPLGAQMPWGGITTYPTASGPRYSLRQFRDIIVRAIQKKGWSPEEACVSVKRECDHGIQKSNLKKALQTFLATPLERGMSLGAVQRNGKRNFFRYADPMLLRAFMKTGNAVSDGTLVDGTGRHNEDFSPMIFLRALQSMYTTMDKPPAIKAGDALRGFFRVAPWKEERAIVEFGFPGPRLRRYTAKEWDSLASCIQCKNGPEITVCPTTKKQIGLAQNLVDLGYIVPDAI